MPEPLTDRDEDEQQTTPAGDPDPTDQPDDDGPETYPAETVRKLRRESAGYRERAKTAEARVTQLEAGTEALQRQLFALKVGATGRLADPADLPFDAALLEDDEALTAAIDNLLTDRPHYAPRRAAGAIGQGEQGSTTGPASFADLLR